MRQGDLTHEEFLSLCGEEGITELLSGGCSILLLGLITEGEILQVVLQGLEVVLVYALTLFCRASLTGWLTCV